LPSSTPPVLSKLLVTTKSGLPSPLYVLFGSQHWKIQGNWSNYDYDHNTGYANSSGQKGCADGTNYPGPYTH